MANWCGSCLENKAHYDQTIALFSYREPISYLITRLKFGEQLVCAALFGQLFSERIKVQSGILLPECLIPTPLHRQRLAERGYNQALCISKIINKHLGIALESDLVIRVKATQAQSSLGLKQRRHNLKNAFALTALASYRHVAIVDDVMTTGHTVNELAKCLKKGGIERVDVWCVARA